jgi:hypothetical protein
MFAEEFKNLIADVPRDKCQKTYLLWRSFLVIAAGLEVNSRRKMDSNSLDDEMYRTYVRKLDTVFEVGGSDQALKAMMPKGFTKETFLRNRYVRDDEEAATESDDSEEGEDNYDASTTVVAIKTEVRVWHIK